MIHGIAKPGITLCVARDEVNNNIIVHIFREVASLSLAMTVHDNNSQGFRPVAFLNAVLKCDMLLKPSMDATSLTE
jgi:hypothetical protein